MAFCANCGTQVQDGVKFCPSCGSAVAAAPQQPSQPVYTPPVYTPPVVPGAPAKTDIQDAQDNKVMSILAYILFFIPLLTGAHKTSPFAKFHANQGTVLFLASLLWGVAYGILTAIFTALLFSTGAWGLFSVVTTILGILWLAPAALCVVGIINAATGKCKPLPVIGKITLIK
jgi:uncharacterized membrane protein